jgi:bifunctional DNA-binding transcriptional regulator/antitoxin component of YhaV-PrlF toxin-antitoxin module
MEFLNTVKGRHFTIDENGEIKFKPKDYFWHIPKAVRSAGIKPGDMVLVSAGGKKTKIIVIDVFRENIEDTGQKYKPVLKKVRDAKNIKNINLQAEIGE